MEKSGDIGINIVALVVQIRMPVDNPVDIFPALWTTIYVFTHKSALIQRK